MIKQIQSAFEWRWRVLKTNFKKKVWLFKKLTDSTKKEKCESLSIVVVGRNDNYGGDFSLRLKTTIDWNLSRFPNAELIYIEWNPIEDKASDTLWMAERYKNAKFFIIPNEVHKSFNVKSSFPILEYFAKNLGIRKASGDWVMLVNADVLLGDDISFNALSKTHIYGSHYNNIQWNGTPITTQNLKSNILTSFAAPYDLASVVGNFILTHKQNWHTMTGYDETLTDVRNGVDTNGVLQLLYHGNKPMVIGEHYHLDHAESLINGANATHGSNERINQIKSGYNIPYKNKESWGLNNIVFDEISPRIFKAKL